MGTRSLTHIKDNNDKYICSIYRQYDGYPSGIGNDIKDILASRELVNGFNDEKKQVNGMNCAAALLISSLKGEDAGNVYVYAYDPEFKNGDCGEDYVYTISPNGKSFSLEVYSVWKKQIIYSGPLSDFDTNIEE